MRRDPASGDDGANTPSNGSEPRNLWFTAVTKVFSDPVSADGSANTPSKGSDPLRLWFTVVTRDFSSEGSCAVGVSERVV